MENKISFQTPSVPISKKLRAVVCGSGGVGLFPPLMERFRDTFEVVAVLKPHISPLYSWWYRLISVRFPRNAWYRKWQHYVEKTPIAFQMYSRDLDRKLKKLDGQYDLIILFGAMFSPNPPKEMPLFVFTDSCRWLSSRNIHDEISHFHSPRDESEWFALEGQVYRSSSRIFVGSDFVRDALISAYGIDPRKAVTSGFGAGVAFGEPYEKVFDGKTILYIGKGDFEKKGGTLLLQAFIQLRKKLPCAVLHIVGQDKLPAIEGVINHGFLHDRSKLVDLMRAAHVFALPSLVDRNPISVLEAMAAATPVIVSDYGAMPGMVGKAGLITPCSDAESLYMALLTILQDTNLARAMGETGKRRFDTIYNWNSVWQLIHSEIQISIAELCVQSKKY